MAEKPSGSGSAPKEEASTSSSGAAQPEASSLGIPRDVQLMLNLLQQAGITGYDPRLVPMMVEFAYRLTQDMLLEAKAISEYAGKKQVDESDVQFAISGSGTSEKRVSDAANKKLLIELATHKNAFPLPPIKQNSGLRLPNDRFCLTAPDFAWHSTQHIHESRQSMVGAFRHEAPSSISADKVMRMLHQPQSSELKRKAQAPLDQDYD
ncbi:hypothetical protein L596_005527 [Steinernema carpocapsae]|uniref:Transcription initiation factor TFIID subunit 9B n=1 Tax=Steinernema carpocapsae TaxID=34508 RepID=A0A4V6I8R2_STECR|nr:hypothetical protein L596_005527 [Steinernema carpocapsae]